MSSSTTTSSVSSSSTRHDLRQAIEDFKICICLNNCGIKLLEQGLYHEAVASFRCSVEGLTEVCSFMMADTGSKLVYQKNYDIRWMLQGAINLCSSSSSSSSESSSCSWKTSASSSSSSKDNDDDVIVIQKISSFRKFDYNAFRLAPKNVIHPIWIDDIECCDALEDPRMGIGLVLYNFALAYRCLALHNDSNTNDNNCCNGKNKDKTNKNMMSSSSCHASEIRLLTLSDSLFEQRLQGCHRGGNTNNNNNNNITIEKFWLVCSSVLVLRNLLNACFHDCEYCCRVCMDTKLEQRLGLMFSYISEYKQSCPWGSSDDFPAAAA